MKQKETLWNTQHNEKTPIELSDITIDEIGEEHASSSVNTPLKQDAFDKSDDEKIAIIEQHFAAIMDTLGLDLSDDSLRGTPKRVAKMYVQEIFSGLNPANKPAATLFENRYKYNQMLVEKDISFYSNCEHHFVPIYGKAHVAYISSGKVIGLSKLNRFVQYYAKRHAGAGTSDRSDCQRTAAGAEHGRRSRYSRCAAFVCSQPWHQRYQCCNRHCILWRKISRRVGKTRIFEIHRDENHQLKVFSSGLNLFFFLFSIRIPAFCHLSINTKCGFMA